jgi:cyanate permease
MIGPMDAMSLWLGVLIGWLAHRRLRQVRPLHGLALLFVAAAAGWLVLSAIAGSPRVATYGLGLAVGFLACLVFARFRARDETVASWW